MASLLAETWARATILIETPSGTGTGFLVGRNLGNDQWRIALITNKHVLGEDAGVRSAMDQVRLHINVEENGAVVGKHVDYPLKGSGVSLMREHPDPSVDVLGISAVPLFKGVKGLANKLVSEDLFGVASKRRELDITAGEEIAVLGYPSGIRQGKTNYPLLREGIIATRIGEELHEEVPQPDGGVQIRISRGFLIDGATIPGSSGSPVVLKPVPGRHQHGNIVMGSTMPVLLGIIAETRFAPIRVQGGAIPGFAGLGLAFDVETIVEVLDLF